MKIKKITKLQKKYFTLDIEVSNSHSYLLSNGVISHNTVSELVDSSSGLHPRFSPYYIRRVRAANNDPITLFLQDQGLPFSKDKMTPNTHVFAFPKKAPNQNPLSFRNNVSSIMQLNTYSNLRKNYCVSGNTFILTNSGYQRISSLVNKNISIWNGQSFSSVSPFLSSKDQLFNVTLHNGLSINATKDHVFILNNNKRTNLSNLNVGNLLTFPSYPIIDNKQPFEDNYPNPYSAGFLSGTFQRFSSLGLNHDFKLHSNISNSFLPIFMRKSYFKKNVDFINNNNHPDKSIFIEHSTAQSKSSIYKTPIFLIHFPKNFNFNFLPNNSSLYFKIQFISGLFDSMPSKFTSETFLFYSKDYSFLKNLQLTLHTINIFSQLSLKPLQFFSNFSKSYFNLFYLRVNKYNINKLFSLGFNPIKYRPNFHRANLLKSQQKHSNYLKVHSISPIPGIHDTYCFTDPIHHAGIFNGILTGNCDHNPSCTVYVKNNEWIHVADWVYNNWHNVGGITFLPYTDHIYEDAPFEEISEDQFNSISSQFPYLDFSLLKNFESQDNTNINTELACTSGVCSIS